MQHRVNRAAGVCTRSASQHVFVNLHAHTSECMAAHLGVHRIEVGALQNSMALAVITAWRASFIKESTALA